MNAIIFDCEIRKAILGKRDVALPGIQYCNGWDDFGGMGISVVGVYDYQENAYRVFLRDNVDEFRKLVERAEVVIGFNSKKFDHPLIAACWQIPTPEGKVYDLLVEVWKAHGLGETFQYPSHIGYGLDACAVANGLPKKTGDGGQAPILWQRGEYGQVIDYCLNDVRVTKLLVDKVIEYGSLASPQNPIRHVEVRKPW